MNKTVLAIMLGMILAGCTTPSTGPIGVDVHTGTDALTFDFKTGTNSIYMCQQTNVIATLRNAGTSDINAGLYLLITEPQVLRAIDTRPKPFSLQGATQYNPRGELTQLTIPLVNPGLPQQLETYTTPFIFQACYPYKTQASVPVCVDPDIAGTNPSKPCTSSPIGLSGGQGAPVAITNVEQIMIPQGNLVKPTFIIHIANQGTGRVVAADALSIACGESSGTQRLRSTVSVRAALGNQELTCKPDSLDLSLPDARIACSAGQGLPIGSSTFTSVLGVELSYGYVNMINIPFTINRLPGQEHC